MGSHGWQLALIVGPVLVNAALSGSEMTLLSICRPAVWLLGDDYPSIITLPPTPTALGHIRPR